MDQDTEDRYGELLSVADTNDSKCRWTPKKRRFCYFMARLGNSQEATERSGYTNREYGTILMQEPAVKLQVQKELRTLLQAETENEDSVIARWARWAQVDIGEYFEKNWDLRNLGDLSEGARKCIKKVKITINQFGRNVDFELHDAHKANNDLAIMMGLLGKVDDSRQAPEETAKTIRTMLKEMNEVDGIQEPQMESVPRTGTKRTH